MHLCVRLKDIEYHRLKGKVYDRLKDTVPPSNDL